jgi:hypothetical protein
MAAEAAEVLITFEKQKRTAAMTEGAGSGQIQSACFSNVSDASLSESGELAAIWQIGVNQRGQRSMSL